MSAMPWSPRGACTRPEGLPRRAFTVTREELSNPVGGASTLVTTESRQPITSDGYSPGPRFRHTRRAPDTGQHDRPRPDCARVEKRTLGRLEAIRFPASSSTCLPRARNHKNDPIPDTWKEYETDEESGSEMACLFAKRNYKPSASVGRDIAV